ncbi:hypothetical protein NDU88_005405 [Pleurodeles waltl]|uniref:Uncharacterized protein n=1 Tax=Pleurodeles waltl TaxID=8319 RepID=A0AAV7NQI2_PLEWA|nr:hypothetical protein NDU88_005405 [Pleurodeles waltl]
MGSCVKGGRLIPTGDQDVRKREDELETEGQSDVERRVKVQQEEAGPDREARKTVRTEDKGNHNWRQTRSGPERRIPQYSHSTFPEERGSTRYGLILASNSCPINGKQGKQGEVRKIRKRHLIKRGQTQHDYPVGLVVMEGRS